MSRRLVAWLLGLLGAIFWLQASLPALEAPVQARPRPRPLKPYMPPAELIRRRVLYLYHQADAPARDILWRHGWPAYT